MNKLTKILLSGAAISALAAVPAIAHPQRPAMHVSAMYAGHAINKTKLHVHDGLHAGYTSYTVSAYTYQPANAPKKTPLIYTYYKWSSNNDLCSDPKEKIKVPKKSIYAKINAGTLTYSEGCSSGPVVFYGDLWTNKTGVAGNSDVFESILTGKFSNSGNKYKGTLDLVVNVAIQ